MYVSHELDYTFVCLTWRMVKNFDSSGTYPMTDLHIENLMFVKSLFELDMIYNVCIHIHLETCYWIITNDVP